MMGETTAQVECYSGHTYAQRPVAFVWNGQRVEIDEIETDENFPEGKYFRVRTSNGLRFELTYLTNEDKWIINAL